MIYADYNGSAPLLPAVREYMKSRLESDLFANPNAIHSMGQKLTKGVDKCRQMISDIVGCHPDQLYFNSGSSEGVSHIIHSVLGNAEANKKIVITSPIEHAVIPAALNFFCERQGFILKMVEIDPEGRVKAESLEKLLQENQNHVALVTIMAANNETGVLQPYKELSLICQKYDVEFFCDTTQLIGKGEFHFADSGVDYAVCSGHKMGALTGTGFVIAKEPRKLLPLVFGSTQEKGVRGGTIHYLGIETLAIAFKDFKENQHQFADLNQARLAFEAEMKKEFPTVAIIGEKAPRLAGTTLIGYPGIHGQAAQIELESHDIFVTTSAACSDNQPETSKVLRAMGVDDQVGRSVIRISLSYKHGKQEYSALAQALKAAYNKLSKIQSY